MKKVVVIGGGFVGSMVAKNLQKDFEVTLIDSNDYFEFTPAILRVIVEPKHLKSIQVLHKHYLTKGKFIRSRVKSFTKKNVILQNDKKIEFDYLVLATGSSYGSKIKEPNAVLASRANTLHETHDRVEKAKNIVVIGGGLVGVELASEMIEKYPKKKITILHSRDSLIQRQSKKAQNYARKYFEKRNVKLVFGDRMMKVTKKEVLTKNGNNLKADVAFLCIGISPNTNLVQASFPGRLNERGAVIVDKYLRVKDFENIFAGGDITDVKEEKTAQNAERHADVIVKNIRNTDKNFNLDAYKSEARIMVISLGKYHGILTYKDKTLTGKLPGILKNIPEWKTMCKYR